MSDPRYTDPRLDPVPPLDDDRARRLGEIESNNAMWGWIAGGVVVVLLLLFIFGRAPDTTNTASNTVPPPAATTGSASTPSGTPPIAMPRQAPAVAPSTTGQGNSQ